MKAHFLLSSLALAVLAAPTLSAADVTTETVSGLEIERATAAPAVAGADLRLSFRLYNNTAETQWLVGLTSPLAAGGALVFRSHHGEETAADGIALLPDETLDFTTSHLVARLTILRDAVCPGDDVPFELVFRRGSATGEADVH